MPVTGRYRHVENVLITPLKLFTITHRAGFPARALIVNLELINLRKKGIICPGL